MTSREQVCGCPPLQCFLRFDTPVLVLSAESFFTGLFPPEGPDSPPPTQIVNLWTMDVDRETEVVNAHECPGVAKQYKKVRRSICDLLFLGYNTNMFA